MFRIHIGFYRRQMINLMKAYIINKIFVLMLCFLYFGELLSCYWTSAFKKTWKTKNELICSNFMNLFESLSDISSTVFNREGDSDRFSVTRQINWTKLDFHLVSVFIQFLVTIFVSKHKIDQQYLHNVTWEIPSPFAILLFKQPSSHLYVYKRFE